MDLEQYLVVPLPDLRERRRSRIQQGKYRIPSVIVVSDDYPAHVKGASDLCVTIRLFNFGTTQNLDAFCQNAMDNNETKLEC